MDVKWNLSPLCKRIGKYAYNRLKCEQAGFFCSHSFLKFQMKIKIASQNKYLILASYKTDSHQSTKKTAWKMQLNHNVTFVIRSTVSVWLTGERIERSSNLHGNGLYYVISIFLQLNWFILCFLVVVIRCRSWIESKITRRPIYRKSIWASL